MSGLRQERRSIGSKSNRLSQERVCPARGPKAWALRAIVLTCLLLAAGYVWAAGPKGTPEKPELYYWYLNTAGPGPDVGEMDPMVREIADAFGRGDYHTARSLALSVLDSTGGDEAAPESNPEEDTGLQALALTYVVESHLAEGDFESARDAAEHFSSLAPATCEQAIKRVNTREADYQASMSRLQHIVDTTDERGAAAEAQLRMARTQEAFGCAELALESCWKAIWLYPEQPSALRAARSIIGLAWRLGGAERAAATCEAVADVAPDSEAAGEACLELLRRAMRHGESERERLSEAFAAISDRHPATRADDVARYAIGKFHADAGKSERAEQEWAALVAERPKAAIVVDARLDLASLRYSVGTGAFARNDFDTAVSWLGRLLEDFGPTEADGSSSALLRHMRQLDASNQRHALFCLAEALEALKRWEQAADTYAKLAIHGSPAEEIALARVVKCSRMCGREAQAAAACERIVARFPESRYLGDCREYLPADTGG